jgi:hypothetical protein
VFAITFFMMHDERVSQNLVKHNTLLVVGRFLIEETRGWWFNSILMIFGYLPANIFYDPVRRTMFSLWITKNLAGLWKMVAEIT